jgi:hypothetical protein
LADQIHFKVSKVHHFLVDHPSDKDHHLDKDHPLDKDPPSDRDLRSDRDHPSDQPSEMDRPLQALGKEEPLLLICFSKEAGEVFLEMEAGADIVKNKNRNEDIILFFINKPILNHCWLNSSVIN